MRNLASISKRTLTARSAHADRTLTFASVWVRLGPRIMAELSSWLLDQCLEAPGPSEAVVAPGGNDQVVEYVDV